MGLGGLSLASLLKADERSTEKAFQASQPRMDRFGAARSCILIYLAGGPSQHETFDPKPNAPLRIRGPWGAIPTRIPGLSFGEMLPELAALSDQFSLVRALNHTNSVHNPWPILTGTQTHRITLGAAVSFLKRDELNLANVPPFVNLGPRLSIGAGALGGSSEPLEIPNPLAAEAVLREFLPTPEIDPERLSDRESLLTQLDGLRSQVERSPNLSIQQRAVQRAFSILTSNQVRDAFDLAKEPIERRDRFGANSFGQSCLLARRLVEAGTRFVQINWYNREDGFAVGWDVHGDDQAGLVRMEQQLCPRFDQGMSALLVDLRERGLLDETLVIAVGEFGRTPWISRLGGRDHWPYCFPALIAGGGVGTGRQVGSSDRHGGYPADRPASPADLAATVCHLVGVNPNQDDRLRPMLFEGEPIRELWS